MTMTVTTTTNNPPLFAEGDRVQERYGWPQHGRDGLSAVKRLGHIVSVIPSLPNGKGEHGWSISVQWDGSDHEERGYTGAALVKVFVLSPPTTLAGVRS